MDLQGTLPGGSEIVGRLGGKVGAQSVIGETLHRGGRVVGESIDEATVQGRSTGCRHRLVHDLAYLVVGEAEGPLGFLEEAPSQQVVEGGEGVRSGQVDGGGQGSESQWPRRGRGGLQHGAGSGFQQAGPMLHHGPDPGGDRNRRVAQTGLGAWTESTGELVDQTFVAEGVEGLQGEQGIAPRLPVESSGGRRFDVTETEALFDELAELEDRQRSEDHSSQPCHPVQPAEYVPDSGVAPSLLGAVEDEQHQACVLQVGAEAVEDLEGLVVSPLQVVEDEDLRCRLSEGDQGPGHRLLHALFRLPRRQRSRRRQVG